MTPEALSELYEAERGPLTRSVERIVGDRHNAEDLVHDAFVAYLASPGGADRPGAWLSRVARNRALNHIRRPISLPLIDTATEGEAPEGGPEREAVQSVVAGALGALHDRDRLALQLRFYEGLDYPQVALRLGVRVEQTHVIVHRAVRRLGLQVVRRLADAHGAAACEEALASMMGLAAIDGEHGEGPCARCRSAWDEISALRVLPSLSPFVVGPGALRRMIGRIWSRAARLAEPSYNLAGAVVGFAVVVSSVAPSGALASVKTNQVARPAVRRTVTQPAGASVSTARTIAPSRGAPGVKGPSAPLNDPGTSVTAGGLSVTDRGDHRQVEEPDPGTGGGDTGVVVCQPLQPCPPPPSPKAGP